MGWEFVDLVMTSRQTFSGFVKFYKRKYKRAKSKKTFMSRNTFIKWWFSWASSMKINFRKKCFGCGDKLKCLAADGTKIGITLKQSDVVPIETAEGEPIKTLTRRYGRTFINNNNTTGKRADVNKAVSELANHVMGKNKLDQEKIDEHLEMVKHDCKDKVIVDVVNKLFVQSVHPLERGSLAKVLHVLTTDASITNTIPKKYIEMLKKTVDSEVTKDATFKDTFHCITKHFFPELGDWYVITTNLSNGIIDPYVKDFITKLVSMREKLEENNIPPQASSMFDVYNPAKTGRAYYFTDHGNQIRKPRVFSIDRDNEKKKGNFDDTPDVPCSKIFPNVSHKGTTYLFLWFCPSHGHCWGYHIITSSEGRKDAANSLYSYLEKAPENIFYDFSCSLEEYCRNRENGFFADTRFFHDIFHGYTHKCSLTYKSRRLLGFKGVNTSICEQFNSFLQCVKTSGKLMTQEHFTFYVEFFIHQWNVARKISFEKRASIAVAGYN